MDLFLSPSPVFFTVSSHFSHHTQTCVSQMKFLGSFKLKTFKKRKREQRVSPFLMM